MRNLKIWKIFLSQIKAETQNLNNFRSSVRGFSELVQLIKMYFIKLQLLQFVFRLLDLKEVFVDHYKYQRKKSGSIWNAVCFK